MSSAAQDEFNQLVQNNRDRFSTHPEDRDNRSERDDSDHSSDDHDHDHDHPHFSDEDDNDDDDLHSKRSSAMHSRNASTYKIPNTTYDANTGPKGVIADAQAFERARKSSFRRTLLSVAGIDRPHYSMKSVTDDATLLQNSSPPDGSSASDDEESFLRHWRTSRMQEMQARTARKPSPRRRLYGSVDHVDAVGYLDAIEKVTSGTVVVVCVYDPDSTPSALVEDCLNTIARRQPTVHFIKLHHEIAEMDHIEAPALLAYRDGDVFATIVEIMRQIPKGRSLSADSLEDLLKMYVYIPLLFSSILREKRHSMPTTN
ncbi:phosducin family protein [Aspergillus saccharolyticus JOP 1030-1]|uniref:Thioredoxin-like protein n=1 Tax=Aspergillus saccharolyticus JOP 1030-1 TaxID=1450539 RepID=A0A318ZLB7_9EURO|nr:thioredoxin-like protein [Aspergillus saccharolyticus JOP 1030-1]PYH44590.1 thioredoxin-like protein [Aspergillus saccharolyticus JOP 1030-1]